MMYPYRCEICGEPHFGSTPPERCPFCGSAGKNVVPAAEWIDYGKVDMCEQSRQDCLKGLELETNNAAYYRCSLQYAGNQITHALFQRLMEQEMEHAEVFIKALGVEDPEEVHRKCCEEDAKNMVMSSKHEAMAIKFYTEAATRAPEPRVRQIFRALAEVENEHLIITNMYIFR